MKRILAKLPGAEDRWTITQVANMTNLEEKSYRRSGGRDGISLLIAYDIKNVVVDCAQIEAKNPCYYSARRERNAKRLTTTNTASLCQAMANAVNAARDARAALTRAEAALEALTGYGEPFSPDSYAFEALSGKVRP
jgi:hypothetical protein